uniref:BTB domain-containing protein n=1 Tax=Mesocestoides corti TaxID=53468 RepID=A0A5K3FT06_MESCO
MAFLAELLSNTPSLTVTRLDEKFLQEIVIFYAQQPAIPIPHDDPLTYLQRIVDQLSTNDAVLFLSNMAKRCLRHKLQMECFAPGHCTSFTLATYKKILLPELNTEF